LGLLFWVDADSRFLVLRVPCRPARRRIPVDGACATIFTPLPTFLPTGHFPSAGTFRISYLLHSAHRQTIAPDELRYLSYLCIPCRTLLYFHWFVQDVGLRTFANRTKVSFTPLCGPLPLPLPFLHLPAFLRTHRTCTRLTLLLLVHRCAMLPFAPNWLPASTCTWTCSFAIAPFTTYFLRHATRHSPFFPYFRMHHVCLLSRLRCGIRSSAVV